jgi:Ricin-type beta-trefoil lectin domain-like
MASPFFIQSKLGDLVIDIQEASTKPGTLLDAWTKKTSGPGWDNQLWTFVPSNSNDEFLVNYYFLQNPASNLVIDIQEASTKPGTLLDAWTKKGPDANASNQLWTFIQSPVQNYYFIQSSLSPDEAQLLVIDIQEASTKPGTLLDAWTKKTSGPGWDNQLWTFVDEKGNQVTPPAPVFLPK